MNHPICLQWLDPGLVPLALWEQPLVLDALSLGTKGGAHCHNLISPLLLYFIFSFIFHINLILPAIFLAVELLLLCCGFCFPGYICVASISFPIWPVFDGDFP